MRESAQVRRRAPRDVAQSGNQREHWQFETHKIPKPVIAALLKAARGHHGDDHPPFACAAQLLEDIAGRPP